MKVLYTFGGIPHYLSAMLNKLCTKGVEITVVTPQKGNATIGKGVKWWKAVPISTSRQRRKRCSTAKALIPHCRTSYAKKSPTYLSWAGPTSCKYSFSPSSGG